jgi:hypothetical protein
MYRYTASLPPISATKRGTQSRTSSIVLIDAFANFALTWRCSTRSGSNPSQLEDVTDAVHDHIASVYAENSPARIYFLILYNLFADFLEDISEDVLPNDLTGYQDTAIWKSALQLPARRCDVGVINKLESYNGCILADSVGLGKTFTALAVIKYYELRNKSVLVLPPRSSPRTGPTTTRT